jgi:DUF1680 family protein
MRGAEGLACAAQSSFFTDATGLYAVRFNKARVKASFGGGCMELSEETDYPFAGRVQLTVHSNTLTLRPVIRLFTPKWASRPFVTLNGRRVKSHLESGFTCISQPMRTGDVIRYEFQIGSGALPVKGRLSTPGWRELYYGPLILSATNGSGTMLPRSPQVRLLPDHSFRVKGLGTVFGTVYHLLDPRIKGEPPYQVQMLFKSDADIPPRQSPVEKQRLD